MVDPLTELRARQKAPAHRYRGADNDGNPHGVSKRIPVGVAMKLEPRRVPERPGAKSRRWRRNRWVVA